MKKIVFLKYIMIVALTSCAINLFGQNKEEIIKKIASQNSKYSTVVSKFSQEKKMRGVKKEIRSEGVLYFDRENSMLNMLYSSPAGNQLLIREEKLTLIDKGKKSSFSTKNDSNMRKLKWTLIFAIGGDIQKAAKLNGAEIKQIDSKDYYAFELEIKDSNKSGWNRLELSYSKSDLSLCVMKMVEKNGNYTAYYTPKKEFNSKIDVEFVAK